jgi:hypothetical protein
MKKKNEIFLSNVEENLKNDKSGRFRNETMNVLLEEALKIKSLKQKNNTPEEYNKIDGVLTALVASMEVVDKRWKMFHEKKSK